MSNTSDIVTITTLMDLHFGNSKLPPHECYERIQKYIYPVLEKTDIFLIGGDFFDTLLNLDSDAGLFVVKIVSDLISLAKQHKFYIRVVRGTYSHDRYQNRLFVVTDKDKVVLNDLPMVRVLTETEIELFPVFNNLSLLYCPDNQPFADLTQHVIDVIDAHKLPKVDFICSHGYYTHLLPSGIIHVPHNTLDTDKIMARVRGLALNGHVHTSSIHKRVVSVGSFERFEHGDEGPKGFYIIKYHTKTSSCKYEFIENKLATPFITVALSTFNSPEETCQYITNLVDKYRETILEPRLIYIRLLGNSPYVTQWLQYELPHVVVTNKNMSFNEQLDEDVDVSCTELPIITEENLASMIHQNIPNGTLTVKEIQEILDGK